MEQKNIFINKNIILISSLLIISLLSILLINMNKKKANKAFVYHDNKLIKEIDLNIDKSYVFEGDKGKIYVTVKNKKIKVDKETSNYHLCSKMGYISHENESIVCLPNKFVIEINGDLDTVVR